MSADITGLQQIVLDLEIGPADSQKDSGHRRVRLRGWRKEGLISKKPTRPWHSGEFDPVPVESVDTPDAAKLSGSNTWWFWWD